MNLRKCLKITEKNLEVNSHYSHYCPNVLVYLCHLYVDGATLGALAAASLLQRVSHSPVPLFSNDPYPRVSSSLLWPSPPQLAPPATHTHPFHLLYSWGFSC